MHDVIRDMSMFIVKSEDGHRFFLKTRCGLKDSPMDAHKGYSTISLMDSNIEKQLHILLLTSDKLEPKPKTYFQSPNALKVLDLSDSLICTLHPSFNLLINQPLSFVFELLH